MRFLISRKLLFFLAVKNCLNNIVSLNILIMDNIQTLNVERKSLLSRQDY